eukprot:PhF_6_TR23305/c0_g1_i1/m.32888
MNVSRKRRSVLTCRRILSIRNLFVLCVCLGWLAVTSWVLPMRRLSHNHPTTVRGEKSGGIPAPHHIVDVDIQMTYMPLGSNNSITTSGAHQSFQDTHDQSSQKDVDAQNSVVVVSVIMSPRGSSHIPMEYIDHHVAHHDVIIIVDRSVRNTTQTLWKNSWAHTVNIVPANYAMNFIQILKQAFLSLGRTSVGHNVVLLVVQLSGIFTVGIPHAVLHLKRILTPTTLLAGCTTIRHSKLKPWSNEDLNQKSFPTQVSLEVNAAGFEVDVDPSGMYYLLPRHAGYSINDPRLKPLPSQPFNTSGAIDVNAISSECFMVRVEDILEVVLPKNFDEASSHNDVTSQDSLLLLVEAIRRVKAASHKIRRFLEMFSTHLSFHYAIMEHMKSTMYFQYLQDLTSLLSSGDEFIESILSTYPQSLRSTVSKLSISSNVAALQVDIHLKIIRAKKLPTTGIPALKEFLLNLVSDTFIKELRAEINKLQEVSAMREVHWFNVDLFMFASSQRRRVVISPEARFLLNSSSTDESMNASTALSYIPQDVIARMGTGLVPVVPTVDVAITWAAYCCGCCGFATEIRNFLVPLHQAHPEIQTTLKPSCFCEGDVEHAMNTLKRMFSEPGLRSFRKGSANILIAHIQPTAYDEVWPDDQPPDYVIGRSMYEFTKLPKKWPAYVLEDSDEVWVPSTFVRGVFINSGIPSEMIHVIPEGIDMHLYNPDLVRPAFLPPRADNDMGLNFIYDSMPGTPNTNRYFKFLSMFKWEDRKGWDTLFLAYFSNFNRTSPVTLYIVTRVWFPNNGHEIPYDGPHDVVGLSRTIYDFAAQNDFHRENLPHFVIIAEDLPEAHVVRLFKACDAFVLPTRGEGWCLPVLQACAMGLPVIVTNFSGPIDIVTNDSYGYLIPITGIEELPKNNYYKTDLDTDGAQWGVPNVTLTKEFMNAVYTDYEKAKVKALRAQEYVRRHFSMEAVAEMAEKRLDEVITSLRKRTNVTSRHTRKS